MSTCQHYSARLISLHTEERFLYPSSPAIYCRVLPSSRMARASSEVSFLVPTPLSAGTIFNTHTRHPKQRLKPHMQVSFLVPTPLSVGTIFNTHKQMQFFTMTRLLLRLLRVQLSQLSQLSQGVVACDKCDKCDNVLTISCSVLLL